MIRDEAYRNLENYEGELCSYTSINLSESDTRAKFVDILLRDVLGWDECHIERDRTYWNEEGRAAFDYAVGIKSPLFVVEAKRKNSEFELPHNRSPLHYSLNGEIKSCPVLWAAILQARQYCDDHGIPYALVTNGRQFALFRAVTLHHGWTQGKAIVFDIASLLHKHFRKIYDALSYECHSVHNLDQLLGIAPRIGFYRSVVDDVGRQVGRLSNNMSDVIEQTISTILYDQPDPSREFLLECYSRDSTIDFYEKSLRGLLADKLPPFAQRAQPIRPGHKKDSFARAFSANIERAGLAPPVLIIGGKGHGKTSFLQWFFKASEFAKELKQSIILWVDFREAGYPSIEVDMRVRRILVNQLENSTALHLKSFGAMKEVFRAKIKTETERLLPSFKEDPTELDKQIASLIREWQQDTHAYLGHLLQYAQEHCKKRIIVVLDNADQKSFEFQVAVHDAGQQLATAFPITLLISMRESTFYRLSTSARSDAFSQQQVFHIRTPSIKSVLLNRFKFLSESLRHSRMKITSAAGFDLNIAGMLSFTRLLSRSILEKGDSRQILELISAISNGNIRGALNLLHRFLVSGHTKMEEYFWKYAKNANSCIPYHEFLASVLLGEMAFFTEHTSPFFLNIFARSSSHEDSHFFRLRLIRVVEALSPGNSFRPEDYVPLKSVEGPFLDAGASKQMIENHIKTLLRFGLLVADTQTDLSEPLLEEQEFAEIRTVHIAPGGKHYADHLSSCFQFVYRTLPDIPICDEMYFDKIAAIFEPFKTRDLIVPLDRGIQATRLFADYLKAEETKELMSGHLARSALLSDMQFTSTITTNLHREMNRIEQLLARSIDRN